MLPPTALKVDHSRRSQEDIGGAKRSQQNQEEPGGARTREEPGGARTRRSQDYMASPKQDSRRKIVVGAAAVWRLSACLSVCLSVSLSVCLSVCLSVLSKSFFMSFSSPLAFLSYMPRKSFRTLQNKSFQQFLIPC